MSTHETAANDIAANCVAGRTRLISRAVTGMYDEALRTHGVTIGQLTILALVAMLEPVKPRDLERYLFVEQSTLSRNLKRMRERGWLAIVSSKAGRNRSLITAPAGRALLIDSYPSWRAAQDRARELLSEGAFDALHRIAEGLLPTAPDV